MNVKTQRWWWWGGVPLLARLAGKRRQARRSPRLLLGTRGAESGDPFSFPTLHAVWNSCPLLPDSHPPPFTNTHTQSNLCAPEPFTLNVQLLSFPSYLLTLCQILLQQTILLSDNGICVKVNLFVLTSGSRVWRRVGWWGIWSLCDGGMWDSIGVDHLSSALWSPEETSGEFHPCCTQLCIHLAERWQKWMWHRVADSWLSDRLILILREPQTDAASQSGCNTRATLIQAPHGRPPSIDNVLSLKFNAAALIPLRYSKQCESAYSQWGLSISQTLCFNLNPPLNTPVSLKSKRQGCGSSQVKTFLMFAHSCTIARSLQVPRRTDSQSYTFKNPHPSICPSYHMMVCP